ncbi:hypothetical protein CNMCM8927_000723 [Aspergillus lentulus]|uniref:Lovastatin diketide synthase LovF n=1 Tax=Aspergillus lentulus TaxID=293939 RepID=A0AAN6BMM4_ASPLE|nr:hypothetical protein CNMCM8060_006272 [Aspergillus lentulus]KAF4176570.1 hypothetical protein CNMCM8060_006293 [Aspergillus lentulus]KAF4180423.1 hypothetical protein CNMCM7927_001181 [Aspergillus lentulus]KAF4192948.1 hypothetical protein CNMCM8694_009514 [Aspergillus lentulus]KAF4202018.1 hypothetical protein CNMCM8927_000723 [Aspergillus lentulus]
MPHRTYSPPGDVPMLEPIAICGMACRLPGGVDSPSSFWEMLVKKQSGQTSRVPESRFNIDAYYHSNLERPGSFNVPGGYFLDGRPEDFDPTAFNMTPIEAQWLDPQQRKILEVAYECLENAGLSLESVAGSNTAVFVGSFTSDYQQMSIRDPDFRHNYAATGVDPGIISNRVGNIFNLKGPSFTINTACSSSIYAIHNACNALRARDCDAALVGGVNLIITVDQHMNTAKLGILSPTSTCHTFDASADGYGRAEGAGALYLKRLQDAIRDGDPVRGVIRASAVNTNGKVEGMGITHPSGKGQETVVRMAYEKAGLDPNATAYAELHGTGTPVGDPIEVRAIASAMNDTRSTEKPLLLGAVKPNIGHSEAASGIFAVMKAALMTEAGVIPGVAHFQRLNPAIHEKEWNVKVNVDTAPWPQEFNVRRASVSSFGYGGTNGHVIIESVEALYPWYQHARAKRDAPYTRSYDRPFLLCFSAHDKATLARNVTAISKVAGDYYMMDLAYTLNMNRTRWGQRAFAIARDAQATEVFDQSAVQSGVAFPVPPEVGFLFTGQGAQWAGMGQVAAKTFPSFLRTIQKLDHILARLDPAPSFRLVDLLQGDIEYVSRTINEAEVAQPLCTAVQIALVDLLSEWGVAPSVSVGHSSGEIAAAYAAGLLSAPEAMLAAYCRGRAVHGHSGQGSMLAVGLGVDAVGEYLAPYAPEQLCIACENSPSSVTLSGMPQYVREVKEKFDNAKVFARELKTGRAYHSPHMAAVGAAYDDLLARALVTLSKHDLRWRRPRSAMISSVTGQPVGMATDSLPPSYWSDNLRSRVLFDTAVRILGTDPAFQQVKCLVEVGPHSALAGPFKQICLSNKFEQLRYIPSLVRSKDDADQLLSVAGALFVANYPVDLEAVNAVEESKTDLRFRMPKSHRLLVDLPPYQWNYEKSYWAEPRASAEQRSLIQPRHDLLGRQITGLSTQSRVWRNVLRHRDLPWLKDHALGGAAIFPAAGHMSLAIEALRQVAETEQWQVGQVRLRDVDISTALVVPESEAGVEIVLRLDVLAHQQPTAGNSTPWYAFSVESLSEGKWVSHCRGKISASPDDCDKDQYEHPVEPSRLTQRVPGKRWYEAFHRVGFYYGPTFQQLGQVRTDRRYQHAEAEVRVRDHSDVVQDESRYVIHPATIDACLQLIIISIHRGKHKEMPWGVVPIRLEEVTLRFPSDGEEGSMGTAVAWTDSCEGRYFNTHTQLRGQSGRVLVDVKSLRCVAYEAAVPADAASNAIDPAPFATVSWKPDVARLRESSYPTVWPKGSSEAQVLVSMVQMIHHRHPLAAVLLCGQHTPDVIDAVSAVLPKSCSVRAVQMSELEDSQSSNAAIAGPLDLVVVDESVSGGREVILGLMKEGQWLIQSGPAENLPVVNGVKDENALYPVLEVPVADPQKGARLVELLARGNVRLMDAIQNEQLDVLIVHESSQSEDGHLIAHLSDKGHTVKSTTVDRFTLPGNQENEVVIIDDRHGTLLSGMSDQSFEALKSLIRANLPTVWLTRGVRQGACVFGGMVQGFLRVIRSEQASARIVQLDVDQEEQPADVAEGLLSVLRDAPTKDSGKDTEFWLHKGIMNIARVVPNHQLNTEWAPPASLASHVSEVKQLPDGVRLKSSIVDGQLSLTYDEPEPSSALGADEIEIQVLASELQTTPNSPVVVSGRVLRCGSAVRADVAAGDQVIGYTTESLTTVVRTACYIRWNNSTNSDMTTTLASVAALSKVVNMCVTTTGVSSSDKILALPGPAPTLHALVWLGKAMHWDVSLLARSPEEQQEYISKFNLDNGSVLLADDIRTGVREKDRRWVILAHDFSSLSQEVWRQLPARSVFVLNEALLDSAPDPLPFSRGASFMPTSVKTLHTAAASEVLQRALDLVQKCPGLANDIAFVHDISEFSQFNNPVHAVPATKIGVVTYRYHDSLVRVAPQPLRLTFSPDASYLLVGCLGGLGRSLTRFMMERGARHFAFVSRTGADKPEAAHVVDLLISAGASVRVFRADAASESDMVRVVQEVKAQRPIRGVVHAAMVLRDGVFEQMDCRSFQAAVDPKVLGAVSLTKALQGVDLDFFVMTSSISATLGNPGQSNYSAANSFLDTLAWQHRLNHRPGVSLVLPMVLDVGVVAENAAIETSLLRKGMYGIDEQEMLRGFEVAMSRAVSPVASLEEVEDTQIILGLEPAELAKAVHSDQTVDAYWYQDARFVHLRAEVERIGQTASSSSSRSDGLQSLLASVGSAERDDILTVIAQYIARRVSSILLISAEDFDLNGPSIASYGLDSMIGAEMRNWLFKEFGLEFSFQNLLSPSLTFKGLAEVVAMHLGVISGN